MDTESENNKTELKIKKKKKKKKKKKDISFQQEMLRKTIHLTSLAIPIIYIFVDRYFALSILIPMALIAVVIDVLSKKNVKFRELFINFFGEMLRKHEKKKKKFTLNGASWVLISACIMVFVFPKIIAITAFSILILSDISAALIGRKFGKNKLFNKTWEGTTAFIIVALIVVFIYGLIFSAPQAFFVFGILSAIISGFVEAASKKLKLDDNLTIPVSAGFILWIGNLIANNFNQDYINLL